MAASAYPYANGGGLLGDLARDAQPLVSAIGGLFGAQPSTPAASAGAPAAASAPVPNAPPSQAPASGDPESLRAPQSAQPSPEQFNQMLARAKPGRFETLMHAWGTGKDFQTAQDDLTLRNVAHQMLPFELARQQQQMAYVQGIQDPSLRYLAISNPAAYAAVMQDRLKPHDTASGTITTGLGGNGDQSVMGSVVSKPGETVGDAAGRAYRQNAPAPMSVAPSNSVFDPTTGTFKQAPAEPKVVTTPAGSTTSLVYPSVPGGTAAPGGTTSSTGAPPMPSGTPPLPRGLRNNNPLNLTPLPKGQWAGQVGTDGRYAQFDNVQDGLAAADKNLAAKQSLHGLNTLEGVIADKQYGWDPGNLGYADTVANDIGIRRDTPLNLQDPGVRARVLASMQKVELGSQAAGQAAQPQPQGQSVPSASGVRTIVQGAMPRQLITPEERAANGISASDRAGYKLKPDGTVEKTADDPFGPERQLAYTSEALKYEPLSDYIKARSYLDSAKQTMTQRGGYADLNLIEMAAKSANPTLAVRPNMIEAYGKERGWTDDLIGKVRATMEHGQALDDAARNALYNTIYTNTMAHYKAAQGMIGKIKRDAAKYGLTPQDLIPDLQEMPEAPAPSYGGNGAQQALAAARAAIQRGAPRAAVIARLRQNGINPAGL